MEKEILFGDLLDEYFDQFGDVTDVVSIRATEGIDVAIELLQNRNGQKITLEYFDTRINEDQQPEIIYE